MSKIEWTDRTLNAFVGCRRVSEGCRSCYAERLVHRGMSPQHRGLTVAGNTGPRWNGNVSYAPHRFDEMLRVRKPQRWFINSLSDLFFEPVPFETIAALLGMMAVAHQWHGHVAQILTKRPERAVEFFRWLDGEYPDPRAVFQTSMGWFVGGAPDDLKIRSKAWERAVAEVIDVDDPFPFWLGVSVEDQQRADERIPHLLSCPAAVRFLSVEPQLGRVDLRAQLWKSCSDCGGDAVLGADGEACNCARYGRRPGFERRRVLHWVIQGGESGHGARPFDVQWARDLRDQCKAAGTAWFCKQLGASNACEHDRKGGCWECMPQDLRIREWPDAVR